MWKGMTKQKVRSGRYQGCPGRRSCIAVRSPYSAIKQVRGPHFDIKQVRAPECRVAGTLSARTSVFRR